MSESGRTNASLVREGSALGAVYNQCAESSAKGGIPVKIISGEGVGHNQPEIMPQHINVFANNQKYTSHIQHHHKRHHFRGYFAHTFNSTKNHNRNDTQYNQSAD